MHILALVASLSTAVAPTSAANGTTLPFQRHLVQVANRLLVAAVQKQGSEGDGLTLYVSADGGASWRRDQPVQKDASTRDTADLLPDDNGEGFALVYSVEPQSSHFGNYPHSDVVYLHYKLLPDGRLGADAGPVRIFQSAESQSYFRASLARDAHGVLHCGATYMNGTDYRYLVRESRDGGQTWGHQAQLEYFGGTFGGGRLIAFSNLVGAILDDYGATSPGRFSTRHAWADDPWSPARPFAWDGLYHAGAFSVVATPDGHLHLGYSEKNRQELRYREYDGKGWSAPTTIEWNGAWSNQPALSHDGNAVSYSWNHADGPDAMFIQQRTRTDGTWSAVRTISWTSGFKGYTAAIERSFWGRVQVMWSEQPHMNQGGANIVSGDAPAR